MKNYLLKCVALLLVGSLAIACGKDEKDDELLSEEKTEETSEGTSSSSSDKTDEGEGGEKNDSTSTSTSTSTTDSGTGSESVSTAVPEEIVPVKIDAKTFPDPKFRALLLGRDYDRNGDGTLDKQEIIYLRNIYCQNMGIKSLKGIEYLKELRGMTGTSAITSCLQVSGVLETSSPSSTSQVWMILSGCIVTTTLTLLHST